LNFSLGRIVPSKWYTLFEYVTPIFWYTGLAVFPLLISAVIVAIRQNKYLLAYSIITAIALIFFSLTIDKVHDGIQSVFYSRGRMFLSIPLVFVWLFAHFELNRKWLNFILIISLSACVFKAYSLDSIVQYETNAKKNKNMYVANMDVLKSHCSMLSKRAKQIEAPVLVILPQTPFKHVYNYACPCLNPDFPQTLEPRLDRRTWVLKDLDKQTFSNILFTGVTKEEMNPYFLNAAGLNQNADSSLVTFSIRNNHETMGNLLNQIGFPMRKHE